MGLKKPPASKKEDRKARIVQAAIDCFVASGVAETTMSQVAQRAKVDQPLIHYYFPSREALYQEVFRVVLESLKAASLEPFGKTANDPVKALVAYVRAPFEWALKEPGLFSIWMYFYYLASFQPLFARLNAEIRQTGRERIAVLIYDAMERGKLRPPPGQTVRDAALVVQGLITGNVTLFSTEGPTRDRAVIDATVAAVLRYLGAAPPASRG